MFSKNTTPIQFTADNNAISFYLPLDWELHEHPSEVIMLAMAPENPKYEFDPQITLSEEQNSKNKTSKDFFLGNFFVMQSNLQDFTDQGVGTLETDKAQIIWLEYSSTLEGIALSSLDYFSISGTTGYVLHCCCPKSAESVWVEHFRNIAKEYHDKRLTISP